MPHPDTIQFNEIAAIHIESLNKLESVERNIQSFVRSMTRFLLLVLFLPKGKLNLSIDGAEWNFG